MSKQKAAETKAGGKRKAAKRQCTESSPSLQEALQYAKRGWAVVPVWGLQPGPDGKLICACRKRGACPNPGKHPHPQGVYGASNAPKRIKRWKWETANVGITTGRVSGLLVLDIDPRNGGDKTLQDLEKQLGKLPDGPMVRTGGGGWHLYFALPEGLEIGCPKAGPGVEVKGDGGYVVAPPSMHVCGGRYKWLASPEKIPLRELPEGWKTFLLTKGCAQERAGTTKNVQNLQERPSNSRAGSSAFSLCSTGRYDALITRYLPQKTGNRNRLLFELAQELQALPEFAGAEFSAVEPIYRRWHELGVKRGVIGTEPVEVTLDEAEYVWPNVRFPKGVGLRRAFELAPQVELSAACAGLSPQAQAILRLGAILLQSDGTFFLSNAVAGRYLDLEPRSAGRLLNYLSNHGFLKIVERGSYETGRATVFRLKPGIARLPAESDTPAADRENPPKALDSNPDNG